MLDVVELRAFYDTALGEVARRLVSRLVRTRWQDHAGLRVLGLGYATPYLDGFREKAQRVLAFMPATQGVVHWPPDGRSASALVEPSMTPLPDASMDRILIVHALETDEHPHDLLEEIWRILAPGGRVLIVAPSRTGLWARVDTTPFGQGHPYSRGQLQQLLQEAQFLPLYWDEALYVPPFQRASLLRSAPAFERIAGRFSLPGGGVHIVEATKQLYRPVMRRAVRRLPIELEPAMEPAGAEAGLEGISESVRRYASYRARMRRGQLDRGKARARHNFASPSAKFDGDAERLRQEQGAVDQSGFVDSMAKPRREVPLGRHAGVGERIGGHEQRLDRDHFVFFAVSQKDGRRFLVGQRRFVRLRRPEHIDCPNSRESRAARACGAVPYAAPSSCPG